MCGNCGCSKVDDTPFHTHHRTEHTKNEKIRSLTITQSILSKNDRLAERNRGYFLAKGLLVLNILSSPGSGKTALIERTITERTTEMAEDASAIASSLKDRLKVGVVVGDLETDNDAKRLRNSGAPAIQITTGGVCHLEADMVLQASQHLNLDLIDILIIENVGNLVCPAAYDLGEDLRVVLLSVTEGEDKPLKYPTMFKSADVVIVNKIDISEAVGFDREQALTNIQKIAPEATIFEVSARTGAGMETWYRYLKENIPLQSRNTKHMNPKIVIRSETDADVSAISEVTVAAFKTLEISNHTEQFIIEALRATKALAVSLVAEMDGRVIGHIAFSPVTISDGTQDWYALGPVSVLPAYQRQGIGKALIQQGLSRLKDINARGCCLVGHLDYYRKFGFENISGLVYEGVPQEFFFALSFDGRYPQGTVTFHEGFKADAQPED